MQPLRSICILILFVSVESYATSKDIRLVGSLGFGSAGAENEGVIKTEEPLALGFSAEYSMSSKFTLGFEHNRSWQGTKSNIGATGVAGRWYLWTSHAQLLEDPMSSIESSQIIQKGYIPYLGVAVGFAQSSLPRKTDSGRDVSVAMTYVSAKVGFESPIAGAWGWRSELNWTEGVVGDGSIRLVHIFVGLYYFL